MVIGMCLRLNRSKLDVLRANYEKLLREEGLFECECGFTVITCRGCSDVLNAGVEEVDGVLCAGDVVPFC